MQKRRPRYYFAPILVLALLVVGTANPVLAETSSSTSFQATEMQFNAGTTLESCSGQYCARASIGDFVVGDSTATASSASFGEIAADADPLLEVIVEPGQSDVGVMTTEQTTTKTMTIRVRNYLSDGYIVQIVGDPPRYQDHTLSAPASPVVSSPGTEQFGINAVANSTPNVGAEPVQVPSSETSFGQAATGYNTPDQFQYSSEAVVAQSLRASGRTDYTISMIINVSNQTPAGRYAGDYSVVVTSIF